MHLFSEANLYIAQALFNLLTFTICNSVYISKKLADICSNTKQRLNRLAAGAQLSRATLSPMLSLLGADRHGSQAGWQHLCLPMHRTLQMERQAHDS